MIIIVIIMTTECSKGSGGKKNETNTIERNTGNILVLIEIRVLFRTKKPNKKEKRSVDDKIVSTINKIVPTHPSAVTSTK